MTIPKSEAPKPRKTRTPRTPVEAQDEPKYYIRNRGQVRVRFAPPTRKKGEEYSYNLAPRGERGDAEPVDEQDLPYLRTANENHAIYELITEEEARSYMYKQTHNQQRYHPALASLMDEYGNPIRGVAHESTPQATILSDVVVPEGDLNRLNEMPPGKPE